MSRPWVDVPRPSKVRVKTARTGEAVAVGYFDGEAGTVPVVGAGVGKRAALAALAAAVKVLSNDPELARELGFRTVAVEGVETGAAVRLGKLVRGAQRGEAGARRALGALKARAEAGNGKAARAWALAQAQHGRGGVARAAHYAPSVAAEVGAVASPLAWAPWGYAPTVTPWVGFSMPAAVADAGTSALLASLYGPRVTRGAISWGG